MLLSKNDPLTSTQVTKSALNYENSPVCHIQLDLSDVAFALTSLLQKEQQTLEVATWETDTDSWMNLLLLLPAETLAAQSQEQMTLLHTRSASTGQSSHMSLKGKKLQGSYKSQS